MFIIISTSLYLKILPNSTGKPQAKQLSSRSEYLLRLLSEHRNTDNPVKHKKSSHKNIEHTVNDMSDEKPSESSHKKEKKKKTVKNEKKTKVCYKIKQKAIFLIIVVS